MKPTRERRMKPGGVLLGVADGSTIWIEIVIGPGPKAVHQPTYFAPDPQYQEQQIADAYEHSGRRLSYLGDWHTHPNASAYLSAKDKKTLRRIGGHTAARQPNPMMVVLGGGDPWQLAVWRLGSKAWYSPRRHIEQVRVEIR